MGGFYSDIARLASEGVADASAKIGAKIGSSRLGGTIGARVASMGDDFSKSIESGLYKKVFAPQRAFEDNPYAKDIWTDYNNTYKPKVNKYISEGTQVAKATGSTKPVEDIYRDAHKKASLETFGPNRVTIQSMLKHVEKTQGKNRADILADHFNIEFKEEQMKTGNKAGLSGFDADMRKSVDGGSGFETPPSPYKGRKGYENTISSLRATLAYKAAPIHMANTLLNVATNDGLVALGKTLNQVWNPSNRAGAEQQLLASNAISELWMNPYREKAKFDAGVISKYAPGSVGEFLHRNMFIPGMSAVRHESIMMGAQSGKLMAEEAVQHLQAGNEKWALPALHDLGLDANKIKRNNFQLDQEDIDKAFYHGANNRVFLDPYDATPTFWKQSPLWRSMKAFTGYITKQSAFERNTIMRQYRQGDFIGIARNIALKSLVYPIVGSTIYEFDRLLSGEDWDDPAKHYENRIEATPAGVAVDLLTGRNEAVNSAKTAMNTIDMLGRLGVWGGTTGYIRGMNRANLAQHILPPEVNVGVQLAQDSIKAAHYDSDKHKGNLEPLERDLLSDMPSLGLGAIASHKLVPTRAEQNAGKLKKFHRQKRAVESSNPLNATDFKY